MFGRFFSFWRNFDWLLLGTVIFLILFGLTALYSIGLSSQKAAAVAPHFLHFQKQLIFVGIGLALFFLFSFFDYRLFKNYAYLLYGIGAVLLVAVLFFGQKIRGTSGWFVLGPVNFQPIEFMKLALVVWLAQYFSQHSRYIDQFRHILVSGMFVLLPVGLAFLQPDLGGMAILFLVWLAMLLLLGIRKHHLLLILLLVVIVVSASWLFVLQDYQKGRILTFLSPESDPFGRGYNLRQSVIAIGAGGFLGRGLGFGSQSQLKFLPESQTDFIFSVIAEELGFLGVVFVLFFFGLLFYRLYKTAKFLRDDFTVFLVLGIGILLFCEIFINIGMSMGLLPVSGVSLPFLSYGGSAMVMNMIMIGIIESAVRRNKI